MNDSKEDRSFGQFLEDTLRSLVRNEVRAALEVSKHAVSLLTPEQLAERLKVPRSWVYEQSRLGNIPTHRIGRYIRFDLQEVLECLRTRIE